MHCQCTLCKRAVIVEGLRYKETLKKEGWKMLDLYIFRCPRCRRDNPDRNYWVKRDIREATSKEIPPIYNTPAVINYLPSRRVG